MQSKNKNYHKINISCLLNNIICKKLFVRKKSVFCFKKCLILVYLLVWLEKKKKSNLIDEKTMARVSILKDCLILEMRIQIFKIHL